MASDYEKDDLVVQSGGERGWGWGWRVTVKSGGGDSRWRDGEGLGAVRVEERRAGGGCWEMGGGRQAGGIKERWMYHGWAHRKW